MTEHAPPAPLVRLPFLASRGGAVAPGDRAVPEETAIAFTYDRCTHAVMMGTPADLEDFAIGFGLAEGIIGRPDDIASLDIVTTAFGIELRMHVAEGRMDAYSARRRYLAGPTGCGLCGIESLEEAMRPAPPIAAGFSATPDMIAAAMAALPALQLLNRETRAVHAAAFWTPERGMVAVREDVGRHNALDKLAGALARQSVDGATGIILLTSRVSIEMVQKTARIGTPILVAVSAPTALAVRTADACGLTLVAIARGDEFEIFTHPDRIVGAASRHVA